MTKRVKMNDPSKLLLIRQLFEDYRFVVFTNRADTDRARLHETKRGICFAALEYLESGGVVDVTITDSVKEYIGMPMYELYPSIDGMGYYLKIKVNESGAEPVLVVVSFHE